MRKVLLLLVVTLCSAALFATAYCQEDMTAVDNGVFGKPRRPSALFAHDEHNEKAQIDDCAECHHRFDEAGNKLDDDSTDLSCADCHELTAVGRQPGLMQAFHQNCKGCHLNSGLGPLTCGQCHAK